MSRLGRGAVVGAAGALAALAGLAVVLTGRPGPFEFAFEFALLVGLLALVQGLRYGLERRRTTYGAYSVGDPEERYAAPPPGHEFDESVSRTGGRTLRAVTGRRELQQRVRAVAATTLAATAGLSEAEAVRRIEEGTWTDDRVAAQFLADGPLPLSASLRALVRGESRFRFGVRRAVAAVAALDASAPGGTPADRAGSPERPRASRAGRLEDRLRERVSRLDSRSGTGTGTGTGSDSDSGSRPRPRSEAAGGRGEGVGVGERASAPARGSDAAGRESESESESEPESESGPEPESAARSATDGGGQR